MKRSDLEKKKSKIIRQVIGRALRDSRDHSVLIEISLLKIHPLYKKRYFNQRKRLVDTDLGVKKGQKVVIVEQRPISKRKSWKIIKVIEENQ